MKRKEKILSVVLSCALAAVGAFSVCALSSCGNSAGATYTRCDENGEVSPTGEYVTFGSYPQSEVTDTELTTSLNNAAGALPTSDNSQNWTSYDYYINNDNSTDYMWYIDLEYSGSTYRGVYFTSYRPYFTGSSSSNTYQDNNGYSTGTVYWFKYEPILWRILSEDNGTALILSETLIDSQQYYWNYSRSKSTRSAVDNYDDAYYMGKTETVTDSVYANNYKYSDIRAWLNETFYNTAFSSAQKSLIQTTTVDNSAASTTDYNGNLTKAESYYCANTNDKVFLLSKYEVTNTAYGFADYDTLDTARQKQSSDYAKSQGCLAGTLSSYPGCSWWLVRSPDYIYAHFARNVVANGHAKGYYYVISTSIGVAPALNIRL